MMETKVSGRRFIPCLQKMEFKTVTADGKSRRFSDVTNCFSCQSHEDIQSMVERKVLMIVLKTRSRKQVKTTWHDLIPH